jgi:hypothetical protein
MLELTCCTLMVPLGFLPIRLIISYGELLEHVQAAKWFRCPEKGEALGSTRLCGSVRKRRLPAFASELTPRSLPESFGIRIDYLLVSEAVPAR